MKNKLFLICIVILMIALVSCVEEYWPELEGGYEDLLVVDGKITNETGPYTINLSKSSSLNKPQYVPLTGAVVTISDDQGNAESLIETTEGNYQTSLNGIQGVIGRKYKLSIASEGKTYESDYEELLAPVGVESVMYKEETQKISTTDEIYSNGYQFYVSTELAANNKNYFYWEIEQTYEHHAPYPIEYIYDGSYSYINQYGIPIPHFFNNPDSLYFCWTTDQVNVIVTQSTEYLSLPKVNDLALHFIPIADERLRIQYSMIAKQYTVSEKAYTFKKSIEDMNADNDDLYVSLPYQIRGNLRNTENPEEVVLGYFLTAGISYSEHLFTPRHERPYLQSERWYLMYHEFEMWAQEHCHIVYPNGFNKLPFYWTIIAQSSPEDWPLFLTNVWALTFTSIPYAKLLVVIDKDVCVDCRSEGGTTQKPDFWIN